MTGFCLAMLLVCSTMIRIDTEISYVENLDNKHQDLLELEWYEAEKSVIRRFTRDGREVGYRKSPGRALQDGILLWIGPDFYIEAFIRPCTCILIRPADFREMGILCSEIGNLHIPVYFEKPNGILVAYEAPLHQRLLKFGYPVEITEKKLQRSNLLSFSTK